MVIFWNVITFVFIIIYVNMYYIYGVILSLGSCSIQKIVPYTQLNLQQKLQPTLIYFHFNQYGKINRQVLLPHQSNLAIVMLNENVLLPSNPGNLVSDTTHKYFISQQSKPACASVKKNFLHDSFSMYLKKNQQISSATDGICAFVKQTTNLRRQ